jgi:L-ribulose-5-phosphate 3-epimerase UlaE
VWLGVELLSGIVHTLGYLDFLQMQLKTVDQSMTRLAESEQQTAESVELASHVELHLKSAVLGASKSLPLTMG